MHLTHSSSSPAQVEKQKTTALVVGVSSNARVPGMSSSCYSEVFITRFVLASAFRHIHDWTVTGILCPLPVDMCPPIQHSGNRINSAVLALAASEYCCFSIFMYINSAVLAFALTSIQPFWHSYMTFLTTLYNFPDNVQEVHHH